MIGIQKIHFIRLLEAPDGAPMRREAATIRRGCGMSWPDRTVKNDIVVGVVIDEVTHMPPLTRDDMLIRIQEVNTP